MNFKMIFYFSIVSFSVQSFGLGENAYDLTIRGYGNEPTESTRTRRIEQLKVHSARVAAFKAADAIKAQRMSYRQRAGLVVREKKRNKKLQN